METRMKITTDLHIRPNAIRIADPDTHHHDIRIADPDIRIAGLDIRHSIRTEQAIHHNSIQIDQAAVAGEIIPVNRIPDIRTIPEEDIRERVPTSWLVTG